MIYCKFKLLQANEDVRRETLAGALIATGRLWLCFGGQTTWQTAPTKQNEMSNTRNSEGKFLQYEPP
jgi:hypothetical protein